MAAVPEPKVDDMAACPPDALASLALRLAAALASFSARFFSILAFCASVMPANSSAFSPTTFGLLPSPRSAVRLAFSASLAFSSSSFLLNSDAIN